MVTMAERNYQSYSRHLVDSLSVIKTEVKSLTGQLTILKKDSLKLSELSRKVVVKNYSLGNADYKDLLEAEVSYQDILAQINDIEAKIKKLKIDYIYKSGNSFL